jgi:hypothetical protein
MIDARGAHEAVHDLEVLLLQEVRARALRGVAQEKTTVRRNVHGETTGQRLH